MPNGQTTTEDKSFKQATASPTRKVTLGGLAGALSAIIVWVLNDFNLLPGGIDIPGEVASALTTVLTFATAYFVPPAASDQIVPSE